MQRQVERALLEEKQIFKEKKCIYQFSNKFILEYFCWTLETILNYGEIVKGIFLHKITAVLTVTNQSAAKLSQLK